MAADERDRRFDKALARHLRSAASAGEPAKPFGGQPHRFGKIAAALKIAGPGARKADAVTALCKKAMEFRSKDGEDYGG